jgi:hypothetical protein
MRQRVCKKSSAFVLAAVCARAVLCARSNEIWTEYWLLAAASSSIFVLLLITLALPLWLAGWLGDVAARDPNTKCTNIAASVREELLRYAWPHTFPPPLSALSACAVCML